jgi:hypothetical protein
MSLRAKLFPESTRRRLEVEARLMRAPDPHQAAYAALQFEQNGGSRQGGEIVAATGDYYRGKRFDGGGWWDEGLPTR